MHRHRLKTHAQYFFFRTIQRSACDSKSVIIKRLNVPVDIVDKYLEIEFPKKENSTRTRERDTLKNMFYSMRKLPSLYF